MLAARVGRPQTGWAGWPALAMALVSSVLAFPGAGATATIQAEASGYTGSFFAATANVSDSTSVVLYEWDFDGDGSIDVNRTDAPDAAFVYRVPKPDYVIRLTVTRSLNGSLLEETATRPVNIMNGTPSVSIDLPDRLVADVPLAYKARATDPDSAPGGEPFAFRWTLDGAPVGEGFATANITAPTTGIHEVAVEATDAEGLAARAVMRLDFAAPGLFEGRAGTATFSLMVSLLSLAFGLTLVRRRRVELRAARLEEARKAKEREAQQEKVKHEEPEPAGLRERGPPGKAPFAAASGTEVEGRARIALGGAPAAVQRTRECPVCHNAVDAELKTCPYCEANGEAEALEARLADETFLGIDLSEVRAVLQRARRERHLGHLDRGREILHEAEARARMLLDDRTEASHWLPRAREALERAKPSSKPDEERVERAASYLRLAESLSGAKQHGKAARHARRAVEILEERGESPIEPAPEAALKQREELAGLKADLAARKAELDEEALKLLAAVDEFERREEWTQALFLVRALREKLERARQGAAGPSTEGPGGGATAPPGHAS